MEHYDDPFIDDLYDLLEEQGFLDPKLTFAEQINLRKLQDIIFDDRRRTQLRRLSHREDVQ